MQHRRRFKFLKELAQGGFGKVYLAEMITGENFSSVVAIKLLHGRWLGNHEIVMRSRDEARLLGRLRHRNIVRVEDLTSINGQCAIVMEYLQGVDLKTITTTLRERSQNFPRKSAFEATGAIAAALDAAYSHRPLQGGEPLQVIHRDIKPSNAMITIEGDVKVLDFGTARASFEEREAKTQVLAFGSQAYMAPERILGEADAPSGDIYSLGITLYECLALDSFGKTPLRQERFEPTIQERINDLALDDMNPALQERTRAALRSLLAYEADARPTAVQVIEEMETLADMATDSGLKRFARESVKKVYEAWVPEQDPNDPYAGAVMEEDATNTVDGNSLDAEGEFRVPPELAELPVDLPSGTPAAEADAPAAFASPPIPPAVASRTPTMAGALAEGAVEGTRSNATWPPPSAVDTGQVSAPRKRPPGHVSGATTSPTLAQSTRGEEPAPAPSGGAGKIFIAVGIVGVLGVIAAVALSAVAFAPGPSTPTIPVATPTPETRLPPGTSSVDWAPNASGKGGAILRVPDGASEVVITASTGFRQEWDGTMNLRLRDLEPGSLRTKVKLTSGGTRLTDFAVEANTTCLFTLRSGEWEKGECR
jgi:serine/threonine protein kinase